MADKFGWTKVAQQKAVVRSIQTEREEAIRRRAKKRHVKPLLFEKERQAIARREALKHR